MRRLVAGMFDVSGRVETCRVREVNALGALGEVVGFANEQGIEDTEWPIATMSPDLLRRLTRRGGKYRLEWFGRERCMFGSDWPVCLLAASYQQVTDLVRSVVGDDENVFGAVAARVYGLG